MYTDEYYRRDGVWSRTGYNWEKGLCMVEFHRMYSGPDNQSSLINKGLIVQDTDIVSEKILLSEISSIHRLTHVLSQSFKPKRTCDDEKDYFVGTWDSKTGSCIGPN